MLKLKYVEKASAIYEKYFSSQVVLQCIGLAEKFATCFNYLDIIITIRVYTFISGGSMWTSYMLTVHAFKQFVVGSLCSLPGQTVPIIHASFIGYTCSSLNGRCNQSQLTIKPMFGNLKKKTSNRKIKNTMQVM